MWMTLFWLQKQRNYYWRRWGIGRRMWRESKAFNVKVGVHQGPKTQFSAHCYSLSCWRLCLENSGRACLWSCFIQLIVETKELLLEKVRNWKEGMEKKGLRVNAGKTKIVWCRLSMGQAEDSGEHPCGVCKKGVGGNSIFCVECHRWVHKRCSGISGKLKSNVDFHYGRCMENSLSFAERGCDWAQSEVGMCSQVLLFGRHTWGRRRGGESSKGQSEMCLGKVQGVISYFDGPGCIILHKGKDLQGLCPECIDIWAMKKANLQSLERTERMMVRWLCGVSLKDRKCSVDLYSLLGVQSVDEVVRRGRLRMFGHVECKARIHSRPSPC